MNPEDDFLRGTEDVAKAFHKYLRGKMVQIEISEDPESAELTAKMKLGNYAINFEGERQEGCGLILYRVKDVSNAT